MASAPITYETIPACALHENWTSSGSCVGARLETRVTSVMLLHSGSSLPVVCKRAWSGSLLPCIIQGAAVDEPRINRQTANLKPQTTTANGKTFRSCAHPFGSDNKWEVVHVHEHAGTSRCNSRIPGNSLNCRSSSVAPLMPTSLHPILLWRRGLHSKLQNIPVATGLSRCI